MRILYQKFIKSLVVKRTKIKKVFVTEHLFLSYIFIFLLTYVTHGKKMSKNKERLQAFAEPFFVKFI